MKELPLIFHWGRQLEKEMSILPLAFCRQDDLLLSWGKISVQHLQKLQDCGMNMPEVAQCSFDKKVPALNKRHDLFGHGAGVLIFMISY